MNKVMPKPPHQKIKHIYVQKNDKTELIFNSDLVESKIA